MTSDVDKFVEFCDSEFGKEIMEREAEYIYGELRNSVINLDVGCGIGSFEHYLSCLNIVGLDFSGDMLKEARIRSDKPFVQGDAAFLAFKHSAFDSVFSVTTLEFLEHYEGTVLEIVRVTKRRGKLVAMLLNPESEYFKEKIMNPNSYFIKIKNSNLKEIKDYISRFYTIVKEEFFLGIRGQRIFEAEDKTDASLYVIIGIKK